MDNLLLKYFHYLCEIRILREKQAKEDKYVAIVAFSTLFLARVFHVSFTGNGQNTKREVCQSINDNYSSFNTYARATHAPTLVLGRMTNREPSPSLLCGTHNFVGFEAQIFFRPFERKRSPIETN